MQRAHVTKLICSGLVLAVAASWGAVARGAESQAVKGEAVVAAVSSPAVVVNGVAIDAAELKRIKKVMLRGQSVPAEQQAMLDKQALDQLISAELLYQAAAKTDVKDLDKQLDAKMKQERGRFKSEQEYKNAIKDLEMDEAALREYIRRGIKITSFVETTIAPKVTVSDKESREFYDTNIDKFKREETVKASHILIGIDDKATAEERKQARNKAEKLKGELDKGADFAELAKANSTCPSSKQGGDLGQFGRGQMVPPFEKAAFALKPGQISDVVETQFGFHVIKVTEHKAAETTDYKEVKTKITDYLKGRKIGEAVQKFVEEQKKMAKIEQLTK